MEVSSFVTRSIPARSNDQSEVGHARRQALAMAGALDFGELRCGQVGIVVTEAARNLSAHGGGGELLMTPWSFGELAGIDVLALDKGTGIPDISTAMRDGFSTSGTPGTGLGAIERLANVFELYSQPGKGTALFARLLRSEETPEAEQGPRMGAVVVPVAAETVSGDAWTASFTEGRSVYLMADGLGHGPLASEAGQEATAIFRKHAHAPITDILRAVHAALGKTRGAAVAIAEILHGRGVLNYTGSGNIAASIRGGGKVRSLVSMNGTPGHNLGSVQDFSYPWTGESTLTMHSDGLGTRWHLEDYPGLALRHPALIAGVLFRDFSRGRDDATVLVTAV